MNRLFRLLWLLLRSRWARPCPPLGPCFTPMRVWPNDLDIFFHVNNGIYLTLCDLGRTDLMLRAGWLGISAGLGREFLVAAETIQLRRPLTLFQRFTLTTRIVGWDDRAFFVEHRFYTGESPEEPGDGDRDLVALALVEARVRDRKRGRLSPADILMERGLDVEPPPLPEWMQRWREDQRSLRAGSGG